jgi:outer membrane protein assembly factor BamB
MNPYLRSSVCAILLAPALFAQDWPQWRGPARDATAPGFAVPKVWPDKLNDKWKITVGEGHASPVVAGNRVYVHTRTGERETVRAIDIATGKEVWQDAYSLPYTVNPAAAAHGKGPKSTPVISGGKLYTLGITGTLSCYDTTSGRLLWRKDYKSQFNNLEPEFGTAMSPLVDRSLLIVHVGGLGNGALIALDPATGAEKWRWAGDGPAYASPIAVEALGTRMIVTQTQRYIVGVQANNGALLWRIPFETEYAQNIVTPLQYRDLLIFSGINKGVFAIRLGYGAGKWTTAQVWENKDVALYMNSPIVSGNLVFGMSHKNSGQLFALDTASGKTLWTGQPRQGENTALWLAKDFLFALTNDAKLIVLKVHDKGATPLKTYQVATGETWATPAVSGNRLVIKDATTLALWTWD